MKFEHAKLKKSYYLLVLAALFLALVSPSLTLAELSFNNDLFKTKWQRADRPILENAASPARSWLWGPESFKSSAASLEIYQDSPNLYRQVLYFDKARMEINDPATGLVTNGLLVRELISGKQATGDSTFIQRLPAEIPVAGDPTGNNGPTYASFGKIASLNNDNPFPDRTGQPVADTLDKAGNTGTNPALSNGINYVYFDATGLKHNIPNVFWNFLNQKGNVYLNGKLVPAQPVLGDNPAAPWLDATGLPVSEAYWTKVTVAGQAKDVLVQAFERRVLTYTPDNPAAYQVEMGNVGRHYFNWRYNLNYDAPAPLLQSKLKKLSASNGQKSDEFGYSVALNEAGDIALVGAESARPGGAAYVYTRNGEEWVEQQILTPSGVNASAFGNAVALNRTGDIALIGASNTTVGGNYTQGAAFIFTRKGTTWTQQQMLVLPDGNSYDAFGWSVALNGAGDMALVGSPGKTQDGKDEAGGVYLYAYDGQKWQQKTLLKPSDGQAYSGFGYSVSTNTKGDTILIGAPYASFGAGQKQGAVYVFTTDSTNWVQQLLTNPKETGLGGSVALSKDGTAAVAGAANTAVYFARNGNNFELRQTLTAPNSLNNEAFGRAVAISNNGDVILIGDPLHIGDKSESSAGAVFVFTHQNNLWRQQKLAAFDGGANGRFGNAVALDGSGNTALIGNSFRDERKGAVCYYFGGNS